MIGLSKHGRMRLDGQSSQQSGPVAAVPHYRALVRNVLSQTETQNQYNNIKVVVKSLAQSTYSAATTDTWMSRNDPSQFL